MLSGFFLAFEDFVVLDQVVDVIKFSSNKNKILNPLLRVGFIRYATIPVRWKKL